MEKTKLFLGANKRLFKKPKTTNKSHKKSLINKVADYFNSDFYMFAPLTTPLSLDASSGQTISASSSTGIEKALKPSDGNGKKLRNKVEEYLKSDLYMYAPLLDSQSSKVGSVPPLERAGTTYVPSRDTFEEPLKGLKTTPISFGKVLKENEQPSKSISMGPFTKSTVIRQTIAGTETVKYVVEQNNLPSSVPGNEVRKTRLRKRVK